MRPAERSKAEAKRVLHSDTRPRPLVFGLGDGFGPLGRGSYLDRFYWALNLACHTLDTVILPDRVRLLFRCRMARTVDHLKHVHRTDAHTDLVGIAYVMINCNHCSVDSKLRRGAGLTPDLVIIVVTGWFQLRLKFRIYWHGLRSQFASSTTMNTRTFLHSDRELKKNGLGISLCLIGEQKMETRSLVLRVSS
jgi:hypothetical protein